MLPQWGCRTRNSIKAGATLFAVANATVVAGHIAEGNLARATSDLLEHPVWGVRADIEVAVATVKGALDSD